MATTGIKPTAIAVYVYRRLTSDKAPIEFLQIRRSSSASGLTNSWQTVYGGVEPGETAVQAGLRELFEETALIALHMSQVEYIETFYFRPSDSIVLMPVFAAEVSPDASIILNHEHDAFRWVPTSELKSAFMWRTQQQALGIILDSLQNPSPASPFLAISL